MVLIQEFKKLKTKQFPVTIAEWAQYTIEQSKIIEEQELQLAKQAPKLVAFENVIDSANTYTLDSVSDILNIGRTTLCRMLEQKRWKTIS